MFETAEYKLEPLKNNLVLVLLFSLLLSTVTFTPPISICVTLSKSVPKKFIPIALYNSQGTLMVEPPESVVLMYGVDGSPLVELEVVDEPLVELDVEVEELVVLLVEL